MFSKFKKKFTEYYKVENKLFDQKQVPFKYTELLLDIGGTTYNRGLYTIHTFESSLKWANLISEYVEGYKDEILPFAYDWEGRQLGVSKESYEGIYLFDPVDLSGSFLDENLIEFHNESLATNRIDLGEEYFKETLGQFKIDGLKDNTCIGYKIPLFLNGKGDSTNYQIIDIEVYWAVQYQLYNQIKDLPDGTPINTTAIIEGFTPHGLPIM
jgi:hypothetical protein